MVKSKGQGKGKQRLPKLRLHRATGQGVVRLRNREGKIRDVYCGTFGTPECTERYERVIGEWLASGRRLPEQPVRCTWRRRTDSSPAAGEAVGGGDALTVQNLADRFLEWADERYQSGTEYWAYKSAISHLTKCYGSLPASEFSPMKLRAVRESMCQAGWKRTNINRQVARVRRVFRWGSGRELIPKVIHAALEDVEGLKPGETTAPESKSKPLVDESDIEAIKPHVSKQVYTLLRLQWLTGARMGELVQIRPKDLKREREPSTGLTVMRYEVKRHKTVHKGKRRVIYFGPRAQRLLLPYLKRDPQTPCFQPCEAEEHRRELLHMGRRVPLSSGNRPGSNRVEKPERKPGIQYTTAAVRKALHRACKAAKNRQWSPHQLRHAGTTRYCDEFGLEVAQRNAGHATSKMTLHYADRADAQVRAAVAQAG